MDIIIQILKEIEMTQYFIIMRQIQLLRRPSNVLSLLLIFVLVFSSCFNEEKRVQYGDYICKGNIKVIDGHPFFKGEIKFYNKSNELVFSTNYVNNLRHGISKEYYPFGGIKQELNYFYGIEHGLASDYDKNGKIIVKTNYYYGLRSGGQIIYNKRYDSMYVFSDLENYNIYSCKYINDSTYIENGGLLRYFATEVEADSRTKVRLFFYVVSPPHKELTYKIFEKNILSGDSALVAQASSTGVFFQDITLSWPKENHKYFFSIEAFYPRQNVRFKNVLAEERREIIIEGFEQNRFTNGD